MLPEPSVGFDVAALDGKRDRQFPSRERLTKLASDPHKVGSFHYRGRRGDRLGKLSARMVIAHGLTGASPVWFMRPPWRPFHAVPVLAESKQAGLELDRTCEARESTQPQSHGPVHLDWRSCGGMETFSEGGTIYHKRAGSPALRSPFSNELRVLHRHGADV
jgi:hypothetical protein